MPRIAWLLLAGIWGSSFILMKWGLNHVSANQLVLVRVVFGLLPVAAYALLKGQLRRVHLRHARHFLAMSLLAGMFYFYGFARGVALLPSGIAGAVTAAIPIFAALVAIVVLRQERLTTHRLTGLLAGTTGIILLANPLAADASAVPLEGIAWMLSGCLSLGASFAYARRYLSPLEIPGAALTTYQLGFALILLLPFTDFTKLVSMNDNVPEMLGLVLGLGVLGTGVAYLLYYYIIDALGAVSASSLTYLSPVIALGIGMALSEPLGIRELGATALLLAAATLLSRPVNGTGNREAHR